MREKLESYFGFVFEKELLDEIELLGTYKKLRENELLVDLGDKMKGVPLLLEGAIKIVREDKNGEEILLYFLERGDTCASSFASAISNGKCGIRAIAEKESEIIFLPKEKLDDWLVKYKTWRNFVIDSYNIRLNEMMETIDTLAFMRMDERLYKYLRDRAQIMRETSLNTTHQEIAYDMHTSRVVVSRLLKQLENEKKVKLHRNRIEILEF
ncbi:Crp/Fnr family transcriptional regulator [Lutibacter sp.]|uniref:Crp/Fnr family transcriptional regulator n=1 Tax=Lutibacter sp. TaxID=1925666 RepID=UPI0027344B81|nr:Crp/Fnr family transcriptional regulator [Lutibacter sp.]MDP3314168.1 Crp/Fnr family transcriptional regulator [Lutibacter sp.]